MTKAFDISQISIDTIVQSLSIFIAIITFIIAQVLMNKRDRKVAKREIYQRLELASIDLFRFEADHIDIIKYVWDKKEEIPPEGNAQHIIVIDYVCQLLNLFEMSIRFRKDKIVPAEVFGSWVIWYFNLCNAHNFEFVWKEVKWDYTSDLRDIIDVGLAGRLINDEEMRKKEFYSLVAKILKCKIIKNWYKNVSDLKKEESVLKRSNKKESFQVNSPLTIDYCSNIKDVQKLVNFFELNIENYYISHGEIQSGRAKSLESWSDNFHQLLKDEIFLCLSKKNNTGNKKIVKAELNGRLVGMLIIEINIGRYSSYCILNDFIVLKTERNKGIGTQMLNWLQNQVINEGIIHIFLESGINNIKAHDFFERYGFKKSSMIMYKNLQIED